MDFLTYTISSPNLRPEGAEVGFLSCGEAATTTLNPEP